MKNKDVRDGPATEPQTASGIGTDRSQSRRRSSGQFTGGAGCAGIYVVTVALGQQFAPGGTQSKGITLIMSYVGTALYSLQTTFDCS